MKLGKLFLQSLTRVNRSPLFTSRPQTLKVGLATLGLSLSAWFSSSKVFSEEMQII